VSLVESLSPIHRSDPVGALVAKHVVHVVRLLLVQFKKILEFRLAEPMETVLLSLRLKV
jgi:hypothetical protein